MGSGKAAPQPEICGQEYQAKRVPAERPNPVRPLWEGLHGSDPRQPFILLLLWPSQDGLGAQKCSADKLRAHDVEKAVYEDVDNGLESPDVYLGEAERQWQIREQTIDSLERALADLDRQGRERREPEAQAIRLASRFEVSEDAFQQEVGLIRARRRLIGEGMDRVQVQLDDLGDGPPDPAVVAMLGDQLRERMAGATPEDRRFVLDAVGATIIAQGDGVWELESEIPQDLPPSEPKMQLVNGGPRLGWG